MSTRTLARPGNVLRPSGESSQAEAAGPFRQGSGSVSGGARAQVRNGGLKCLVDSVSTVEYSQSLEVPAETRLRSL